MPAVASLILFRVKSSHTTIEGSNRGAKGTSMKKASVFPSVDFSRISDSKSSVSSPRLRIYISLTCGVHDNQILVANFGANG